MDEKWYADQRQWEKASTSADHAVWVMVMDMCPDEFEKAVRAGKVAFLSRILGLPHRVMVQRARRFREVQLAEKRLDYDDCWHG